MQVFHHSRELRYRSPYGARPGGDSVHLAVNVKAPGQIIEDVTLCYTYGLYSFSSSEVQLEALDIQPNDYQTTIRLPREPGIFFYWFRINIDGEPPFWYIASDEEDGTGQVVSDNPGSEDPFTLNGSTFRITVYDPNLRTPDWAKGNVMYQIFPDRFSRDKEWTSERMRSARHYSERIYHDDWFDEVDIDGKPETGYLACDFFGGSLNGIREKLDYIQDLGIGLIYLNPVFMGRSNHRYDTADYFRVDPMLGTNEDFRLLCAEAAERDIRVIIDGVFSHTGADSIYFNKFHRFTDEIGAYQQVEGLGRSPYYSWYDFNMEDDKVYYKSWWGFADLPSVKEEDLTYREFILGQNGVVRHWLREGASGYRLDVSDELPDDFLREFYATCKEEKPDSYVLGEVWEDASAKVSYGSYRDFVLGRTHDAVMGYTFKDPVTDFFAGEINAYEMNNRLESVRENYPEDIFACNMNLLSSHDIPRFITTVAGDADPMERAKQIKLHLSPEQRRVGEKKLVLAYLMALTYPGCPSIYYGDEIGLEGYRDPFNRRTFDASKIGSLLQETIGKIVGLRRQYSVLQTGQYRTVLAEDRHFAYMRYAKDRDKAGTEDREDPELIYVVINADEKAWTPALFPQCETLQALSGAIIIGDDAFYFSM